MVEIFVFKFNEPLSQSEWRNFSPGLFNDTPARRKTKRNSLTALELCAGGGGAALGLEEAGFTPLALFDKAPHACATLRTNRPYWNVIQADIRRFDFEYWRG